MNDQPTATRLESDSIGEIALPADRYRGARTRRSLRNLGIGGGRIPVPPVRALGLAKQAAAETDMTPGVLGWKPGEAIAQAAAGVVAGKPDDRCPLAFRQTGSGTRSDRNVHRPMTELAREKWRPRSCTPSAANTNSRRISLTMFLFFPYRSRSRQRSAAGACFAPSVGALAVGI